MNRRAGYSLLEVLVAFSVMMLVLAALLPGQSRLAASSLRLAERQLAHEYALSRLALAGRETVLASGADQGSYQDRWLWREEVTPNISASADRPLYDIRIVIETVGGDVLTEISAVRAGEP